MRRYALCVLVTTLAVLLGGARPATASPPQLLSAVSHMTHGPAGNFDIELPLKGGSGVEYRSTQDGLTIVMTFNQPLAAAAKITVAGGKATAGKPRSQPM